MKSFEITFTENNESTVITSGGESIANAIELLKAATWDVSLITSIKEIN